MGFINDLVESAFDILAGVDSSLVESINYVYQTVPPDYDVTRGTVFEDTAYTTFNATKTKIKAEEMVNLNGNPDLELKASDRVYLVAANLLGRTPELEDEIVIGDPDDEDSPRYRVVGWFGVPGDSLYKVVCRRP